ncbi:hypothetical protein H6P81_002351 [Aristolochia fimbriata]|uniref:Uncharacterized protein n=1 Tax=Aristolochia fimbriata TaxID=158543 RepID=A0AAV7FA80_ARIFI|nr:hypothetical protein H6P81_002351 [Aristolochia fimbriata]
MAVMPTCCYFGGEFVFEHGNVVGYSGGATRLILLEPTCLFNALCTMMYNVLEWNSRTDRISIWMSFTCNDQLMYTLVLDDMSLESGLGMVKHGFQSMLVLFVKRDTYPYEIDSRGSLKNVGGTDEGVVMVYEGRAPAEWDERVEGPIVEFIPEERKLRKNKRLNSPFWDVVVLLGLHVDGFVVTGSTRGDWIELARVLLGVELPPESFQGGRLSLSWIRGRFSFCPEDVPEEVIQ